MVRAASLVVSILALLSTSAVAGDIYRFRTVDGRTILTDSIASVDTSARLVETARYDGAGHTVRAPALPDKARDRALEDVRYAESELLHAYNRLTVGVAARQDELMPAMDESTPAPRKGKRKVPRSPEYYARVDALKADIDEAQKRLDQARERLYALN